MVCPVLPGHRESSPFVVLDSSFRALCAGPDPLAVPAGTIAGLPDRPLPLDELRDRLLHPSCRHTTRDAAIGWLLVRAHDHGDGWLVALAGVLLPGLCAAVDPLIAACPGKTDDIEAEALVGLLDGIARTAPDHPRAAARLRWLARNRARRLVRAELAEQEHRANAPRSAEPPAGYGHPDLVLAAAVDAEVIRAEDAALIGDTRLGLLDLEQAAAALGVTYKAAQQRRRRAETALASWLTDPETGAVLSAAEASASKRFVAKQPVGPCSSGGGRPRTGRGVDRRPAVRHPLPIPDPRR